MPREVLVQHGHVHAVDSARTLVRFHFLDGAGDVPDRDKLPAQPSVRHCPVFPSHEVPPFRIAFALRLSPFPRWRIGLLFFEGIHSFSPSQSPSLLLWLLLTPPHSLLLHRHTAILQPKALERPRTVIHYSFLVYLSDLQPKARYLSELDCSLPACPLWVPCISHSGISVRVTCSSGHDFAIASFASCLTTWSLQVAIGFVGIYAP
jgi:hypothetical protein